LIVEPAGETLSLAAGNLADTSPIVDHERLVWQKIQCLEPAITLAQAELLNVLSGDFDTGQRFDYHFLALHFR
jgi:hypothetical protein